MKFRLRKEFNGRYIIQSGGLFGFWSDHINRYTGGHRPFVDYSYEEAKEKLEALQTYWNYKPTYIYPPLPEKEPSC